MSNDEKYGGRSRGLWRKVYGYQNNKPQVVAFVDTTTNTTMSLDLNRTFRHRDYFFIDSSTGNTSSFLVPTGSSPTGSVVLAEYDEGTVTLSNTDIGAGYFNFTFSSNPVVVLTVDSASQYNENVVVYGLTRNSASFTFGTSAPFAGTIRYRAIYSASYPAYATSSFTASITASAGATNPAGLSYYTASFAALPGVPFKFLQTAWDFDGNMDVDVALQTQSSSSSGATTEISAPMSSSVHYIAFYST